jgi:beta-lactamase regulating signal transducer with metallopeptidase domain
MNSWLLFLFKSTLVLSLLYLSFRLMMRNETIFRISRLVLLLIVFASVVIPLIYLPESNNRIISIKLDPIFQGNTIIEKSIQNDESTPSAYPSYTNSNTSKAIVISTKTVLIFIYLTGVFVSLFLFIYSIYSVLRLFKKSQKTTLYGIQVMIHNGDIPAFSFRRRILISRHDYDTDADAILTHELSHIRHGHFYDLILMEMVKIIYWFNPLIYRMGRDLKDIHEFQADEYTLNSGIDSAKYQLLIIKKCVGHQSFALANSFNHCQIKKRITMMNKSKTSKAWCWKVATFLPMLALLLMAFGKRGENVPEKINLTEKIIAHPSVNQKQNEQFKQKIEIKKDGSPEKVQAVITGYKMNDTIKMADFLKLSEISLNNREYSVLSFQLAFEDNGIDFIAHSNSNKITEEQKNIFLKRKDKTKDIIRIYIERIKVQQSQGNIIDIPPLIYSLKIK